MSPLNRKITLNDLRAARHTGGKLAMLTCYDFLMARLMQEAGVPALLVGDSAASVILGHDSTLPAPLGFMIELTAAVRRGAPLALLVADMPFGSYQASDARGAANVMRMVKTSGCDCVKLEVGATHCSLIQRLADAGVAVMAHMGLRPQSVGLLGGYRYQARTAQQVDDLVALALQMQTAGASSLLLEAVPPEAAKAVVDVTNIPVIGCGAGPHCHGHVVVTHDSLGLTAARPKFVPQLAELAGTLRVAFARYADDVRDGRYPQAEHDYQMPADEAEKLKTAKF